MERKDFLKNGLMAALGFAGIVPLAAACNKTDSAMVTDTETGSGTGTGSGSCTVSPSETAGPFPTKSPSSVVTNDITSDRTGVPFTINININNKNNNCAALAGAIVDIWHCDKDGYYSEYGGSGMQSANFTSVHFLRGRQTTDANGLVSSSLFFRAGIQAERHIFMFIFTAQAAPPCW